jgi:hypothetical protein
MSRLMEMNHLKCLHLILNRSTKFFVVVVVVVDVENLYIYLYLNKRHRFLVLFLFYKSI